MNANMGQFFTHKDLCKSVIDIVNKIKPIHGSILEPSFGSGNFIDEILKYPCNVDGIEIDKRHFDNYIY